MVNTLEHLIEVALAARANSYCPYSHFAVACCLEGKDGSLWTGINIENAAFTAGNCAERTALFKAISEGCSEFSRIVIVGGPAGQPANDVCAPCGVCRQALAEFCDLDEFKIFLANSERKYQEFSLRELLPLAFTPKDLAHLK